MCLINSSRPTRACSGRHHQTHGHARRADALLLKAKEHLHLGGGDPPPPAAALAMPVPQHPTFTQAFGRRSDEEPPDPAA